MGHHESVRVDSRTLALGALAVALALVLGGVGVAKGGVAGGAIGALAGLLSTGVLAVAMDRWNRHRERLEQGQEALDRLEKGSPTVAGKRLPMPEGGYARLLRPEEEVVSFRSRPELDELFNWCVTGSHIGVRLVTGEGGVGKTRLVVQLGRNLSESGWRTSWVLRGGEEQAVSDIRLVGQPTVLLVDYAETRDELSNLLAAVASDTSGPDMRVVLLARSAGEWWQQLITGVEYPVRELLARVDPMILGPLTTGAVSQQEVFDDAVAEFAARLKLPRPHSAGPSVGADAVVLVQHAAALLAVLNDGKGASDAELPQERSDVIAGLLRHEAGYWQNSARARGLDLESAVLRRAVAVACLAGADNELDGVVLLQSITDLADSAERRGQVVRWLHDLYPVQTRPPVGTANAGQPDGLREEEWLGSLQPDLLAERLIVDELGPLPSLMSAVIARIPERRVSRVLTILARAAYQQPSSIGLLRAVFVTEFDRAVIPAVQVAVETNPVVASLIDEQLGARQVSLDVLTRMADAIIYPTVVLAPTAATVLKQLLDHSHDGGIQRVGWLLELSNYLADLGRHEEAVVINEEAIAESRLLAQTDPDNFLFSLALTLNNHSNRLAKLGRREDALAAIEEAVAYFQQLAQTRREAVLPTLAGALNNQSNHLADLGRNEDALAASEKAATLYRQLAEASPDIYLPGLAMSLTTQRNSLSRLGRHEEALAAISEAVRIRRQLAETNPDSFLPSLALSLNNQWDSLSRLGRHEEALAAISEAVRIRRQLAETNPDAFLPDLTKSLTNQFACLIALESQEQALAAIRELAGWPTSESNSPERMRRADAALEVIEEVVALYRRLGRTRGDAVLPELADSLNKRARCLVKLRRYEDAMPVIEEVVVLYRQLAQVQGDAFLPELAGALKNQYLLLTELQRRGEAVGVVEETVTTYRHLAQAEPDTFLQELATSLQVLIGELTLNGQNDAAKRAQEELTQIRANMSSRK